MATDDKDIDEVLAEIELELIEDDPQLVHAFGALWHPSLKPRAIQSEQLGRPPRQAGEARQARSTVALVVVAVLIAATAPGILVGEWVLLQAAMASALAALVIVAAVGPAVRNARSRTVPTGMP